MRHLPERAAARTVTPTVPDGQQAGSTERVLLSSSSTWIARCGHFAPFGESELDAAELRVLPPVPGGDGLRVSQWV